MRNATHTALLFFCFSNLMQLVVGQELPCSASSFNVSSQVLLNDVGTVAMQLVISEERICFLVRALGENIGWVAFGITSTQSMVNSPVLTAVLYNADSMNLPALYELGGYQADLVTAVGSDGSYTMISAERGNNEVSMIFERPRAAGQGDAPILSNGDTPIIWAYGTSFPITSHDSGTRGSLLFNFDSGVTEGVSSTSPVVETADTLLLTYVFVAVIVFLGMLLTVVRKTWLGRLALQSKIGLPSRPSRLVFLQLLQDASNFILDLRIGEMFVLLIYIGVMVQIALGTQSFFEGKRDSNGLLVLVTGHLAVANLALLLLPISKFPLWPLLFGIGEDRMVKFHRFLGRLFILLITAHLVLTLDFCTSITSLDPCGQQLVVPLYGLVGYVSFASMGIMALEFIRRKYYELFFYVHRIAFIIGTIAVCLHATIVPNLLILPGSILVISYLYRAFYKFHNCTVAKRSVLHKSVFLELKPTSVLGKLARNMKPGAFCWVLIPSISKLQWHPFSIISSPNGDTIGFGIKQVSDDLTSYSAQVVKKLKAINQDLPLSLFFDGPYGKSAVDVQDYNRLVYIAGGIGITPWLSMLNQSTFHTRYTSVSQQLLIWVVRYPEDILQCEAFMFSESNLDLVPREVSTGTDVPMLSGDVNVQQGGKNKEFLIFVTQATANGYIPTSSGRSIPYYAGRPNWGDLADVFHGKESCAVLACGPPPLVFDVQKVAAKANCDFHKEEFNW